MADSIKIDKLNKSSAQAGQDRSISMHDDIPVWYDCCSCEAEPYWLEAMGQSEDDADKELKK